MNPESSRTGTKRKHTVQRSDARGQVIKDIELEDLTETNFCTLRFLTDQVHKDYLNIYQHRPVESECRFERNDDLPQEGIVERYNNINYKGLLTKEHARASTVLVREFYANGKYRSLERGKEDPEKAFVRKKNVSFNTEDLRRYFGLPFVANCEYKALIDQSETVDVIPTLCAGVGRVVNWHATDRGRVSWFLKKGELNRVARWWMYVLCSNVWGIQHVAEVHYERAVLIYCCMTGKQVDFPKWMLASIKDRMKGATRKSLGFPHFVTYQCLQAGIPIPHNMLDVAPPEGTTYFDLGGPHPPGYEEPPFAQARSSRGQSAQARFPQPDAPEEPPESSARDLMRRFIDNQEIERKEREEDRKLWERRNRRDKKAYAALTRGITELQARFDALNPGHHFDPFTPLPSSWSTSSGSGAEDNVEPMNDE